MRVLAFSDVHLGAHGRTDDQEHVLARVAALAIEERVDAVLFAGDMFEGPGVPSSHYVRVRRALCAPLGQESIPVVAISGNSRHDSAGNQGEENAMAVLQDPWRFEVRTRPALVPVDNAFGDVLAVVACVPWASVNRLRAHLNGTDDTDALAAQLVIRIMEQLRAEAERDYPGVPVYLVSHFATSGWKTPTGLPTDEIRDVVLPLDEIERLGFDAVCLGHIHVPGVINGAGSGRPPIISLGSPGCLNHGEGSVEHGVWILGGEVPEFRPIKGRRFHTTDLTGEDAILASQGAFSFVAGFGYDGAIVRVRYSCTAEQTRRINQASVKTALLAAGAHEVTVEATVEREARARVAGMTATLGPLDALDLYLASQSINGSVGDGVRAWTREAMDVVA